MRKNLLLRKIRSAFSSHINISTRETIDSKRTKERAKESPSKKGNTRPPFFPPFLFLFQTGKTSAARGSQRKRKREPRSPARSLLPSFGPGSVKRSTSSLSLFRYVSFRVPLPLKYDEIRKKVHLSVIELPQKKRPARKSTRPLFPNWEILRCAFHGESCFFCGFSYALPTSILRGQ